MTDSIIQAKADRFVRMLRRSFRKTGNYSPEIDESLIAVARRRYVAALAGQRGGRVAKRKRKERTIDMFGDETGDHDAKR